MLQEFLSDKTNLLESIALDTVSRATSRNGPTSASMAVCLDWKIKKILKSVENVNFDKPMAGLLLASKLFQRIAKQ